MSIHLTSCAAELPIPAGAKLALMAFADSADDYTHISVPGYEKVQKWASVGRSRSNEIVGELVALNLLRLHRRGRRGSRAEYVVFPHGCCSAHPRHAVDEELRDDHTTGTEGSGTPDPDTLTGSTPPAPTATPELGAGIPDSSHGTGSGQPDPNQPSTTGSGPADPSRGKRPERVRRTGPLPKQEELQTPPPAPSADDLVEFLMEEENIDYSTAIEVVRRANADTASISPKARLRKAEPYRRQLIAAIRAERDTAAAAATHCPHGITNGRRVTGHGQHASRLCPDCERVDPAPTHDHEISRSTR